MEKYDLWKTTPPEVASHPCKICEFDVYNNEELCQDCLEEQNNEENKEEMNMSAVELIKSELCSRYGINPEQIQVDVSINDVESVELADEIKNDYEVKGKAYDFLASYRGYNQENDNYIVGADHGTYARSENILNIKIRTKKGVLKGE